MLACATTFIRLVVAALGVCQDKLFKRQYVETTVLLGIFPHPSALPHPPFLFSGVAAPFTSRIPSVRAVVDLIRQGRCTLLSALMQQQIMMLESCIAAYTLSALSLHNARSSVSTVLGCFVV